jgi:hypothetical protein
MNAPQDTFALKATGQGLVWGLKDADDDWAICEFNDGEFDAMLLWVEEKAAKACAVGEWSGYKPTCIELKSYLDSWLPAMKEDGIKININFGPRSRGSVIEVDELVAAIRAAHGV